MNQKEKLQIEAAEGQQHQRIWETYVSPFFTEKKDEFFKAFVAVSADDKNMLQMIKMNYNVLEGLENYFQEKITTGKLAQTTLEEEESNGK